MQSALHQLAMVIGVGTLGVLLLRGYSLTTALFRSGIVLILVMILLIIANAILSWIMTPSVNCAAVCLLSTNLAQNISGTVRNKNPNFQLKSKLIISTAPVLNAVCRLIFQ